MEGNNQPLKFDLYYQLFFPSQNDERAGLAYLTYFALFILSYQGSHKAPMILLNCECIGECTCVAF